MSVFFVVADRCVWNPANTVADLYRRTAIAGGELIATPTGLGEVCSDECAIDPHQLGAFTTALLRRRHQAPNNVVLHSLVDGCIATSLVLVERSGLSTGLATDPLTVTGADTLYWRSFMERHAAHMPR